MEGEVNGFARGRGGERLCKGIRDLKKKKFDYRVLRNYDGRKEKLYS
jgi:hypothetical protein